MSNGVYSGTFSHDFCLVAHLSILSTWISTQEVLSRHFTFHTTSAKHVLYISICKYQISTQIFNHVLCYLVSITLISIYCLSRSHRRLGNTQVFVSRIRASFLAHDGSRYASTGSIQRESIGLKTSVKVNYPSDTFSLTFRRTHTSPCVRTSPIPYPYLIGIS